MTIIRHLPVAIDPNDKQVQYTHLPLAAVVEPGFHLLLKLWDRKRRDRVLPARADFDPVELKPVLSRMMLIEVVDDPPDFRYRLAGTVSRELTGIELTGQSIRNLVPRLHGQLLWNNLCDMLEDRKPQYVQLCIITREGEPLSYRVLRLPLGADGETADMVMVVQDHGASLPLLRKYFDDLRDGAGRPA